MLEFVIAGLVLGGIYAIASAGLVITYTASGILNFAFGAMAFFIARFYYYLHTEHSWSILTAAIVSIGIAGPLMGIVLYAVLFRHLRFRSPLIKVVATVGLLVAIPAIATVIFGAVPSCRRPVWRPSRSTSTSSSACRSRSTRSSSTSASSRRWSSAPSSCATPRSVSR